MQTKRSIAIEFIKKYPKETPNLKLARMLYKKEPLLFNSLDHARSTIRDVQGKLGSNRKSLTDKSLVRVEDKPKNPYNLPESYEADRKPFKLPLACNNILLLSDLHIPYHNIEAVTIALEYGKKQKVNTIFINGDLIDNSQVSKFESDPRKRSPKQEFDATKQFLVSLRKLFPQAEIYWLKGNHCIRWEKFLLAKVSEIWDDPYFTLEERLRLNEERVHLLDDRILVKAGKLSITHGHLIFKGFFVPVSPARGAYLRAKQSLVVGHLHRLSHVSEVDLDGNIVSCFSTGCLCELRPNYSPLVSNSQHGFAHITVEKNGDYHVRNFQIIKGKVF